MLDPQICIPIIIVLHIIGIISGYVIMENLIHKEIVPYKEVWKDMYVIGGVLWMMAGIFSPLIIWITYKLEK